MKGRRRKGGEGKDGAKEVLGESESNDRGW